MSLVTLADFKAFTPVVGTSDDVFIQMQLDLASDAIERFCKRRFALATYIETFYNRDVVRGSLSTYHYPIVDVQEINGVVYDNSYLVHKPSGKLTSVFPQYPWGFDPYGALTIQYTAGFAEIPSPIKFALLSIVAGNYNKKKNGIDLSFGSDVQRMSIPGTISIDFDYSLQNNEPQTEFGLILGSLVNVINPYVSDRAVMGQERLAYVEKLF